MRHNIVLIHWNVAEARVAALRAAGYSARHAAPKGETGVRQLRTRLPDAFIIDLTRSTSNGAGVATLLRGYSGTRRVALVFAGGAPDKVEGVRALFPDAVFTEWEAIADVLKTAIRNVPEFPVAPKMMAGYSGTPLPKKLGIKEGGAVLLSGAPDGFEEKLGPLPAGARVHRKSAPADRVLLFVKAAAELERRFDPAAKLVNEGGGLWVVWPKRASGIVTDVNENGIREHGLQRGWVDYKVCAVDETWSGLLFARRKATVKKRFDRV